MPAHSPGDQRYVQSGTNEAGDPMYVRATGTDEGSLDYQEMTKDEIQQLLRNRDLPTSGNKDELIARLEESE